MNRKIKSVRLPQCEHDYTNSLSVAEFKRIGDVFVIRSINTMYQNCSICGHETDFIIGAGYVFANEVGKC